MINFLWRIEIRLKKSGFSDCSVINYISSAVEVSYLNPFQMYKCSNRFIELNASPTDRIYKNEYDLLF